MGITTGPATPGVSPKSLEKLHTSEPWRRIRDQFFASGNAAAVQAGLTAVIDRLAMEAFAETLAAAFPKGAAMLAVGGFGRRELFPYSDIDIMILLDTEALSGSIKDSLSSFVRLLWDAGLRLSHSVHTVSECLEVHEQNIELNISLLDRRFLSGDHEVFAKLESRYPAFLSKHGQKLGRHLCELTRARHSKFQDTLFHLEPDVKETPGGLRDLHFINWLARLRPEQRSDTTLEEATAFLSSLRCFLHYQAGRDRNILNFEAQESITEQVFTPVKTAPLWMREYFRNARVIFREAARTLDACERGEGSLLANFRDWRSRLSNAEFSVLRERVYLRSPALLESDPEIVFRLLEFVARHGIPAAAETERRLEGARASFAHWCATPRPLWKTLKNILTLPHAPLALRILQDTGHMQVLFPEWESVVSLVVRDFYHRYTVDEHTLVAIERIAGLSATGDAALVPFARLLSEIDNPGVLLFALLFHDIGKGAFSGDHSRVSVERAREAMARIQVPAEEQSAVEFLIANHLVLSEVMTTRDLGDPATARAVADRAGTIEQLKLLTVMTYADISAVNPGAMTPWRLEQLWRVYRVTQQELTRELETERIQEVPKELPERAEFIKGFPVRYLRTHSTREVELHLGLYQASRPTGVALKLERAEGAYRLTIVARDTPFLFASLAGALSSFGLDILKAEAFSNARGVILDTFVFSDPKRTLDLNPSEADRLQDMIRKVATGKTDVQRLLRSRPPTESKRRGTPPSVSFDSEACETATLVEIVADDRPGLLYSLATALSTAACNIDVVLIDTKGSRAIDVFYVAHQGHKLSEEAQAKLKERLLAVC
ncbi:MAG TPA: HD domain-containing protein [Bryobacteraceae bacterium]|nr:HD domain-containing protein [Bryobacteraceae bacterium]